MNNKTNQTEYADFRHRVENEKQVTLDCGKKSSTYYDGNESEKCSTVTPKQILEIASSPKYNGYAMVGEDAHFGVPQNEDSYAQPFKKEQLLKFYKDCVDNNIILRLFPQKSTPRAAAYAGLIKSDETDPISIYKLVRDFPEIALRKPPESFELTEIRKEGYKHKDNLNQLLNFVRTDDYSDSNTKWLIENIEEISSHISPVARDAFIKYYKKGGVNINATFKPDKGGGPTSLYSILGALVGKRKTDAETGEIYISRELNIRESTGELPSWKFAKKHIFNFGPWHQKGGVARSNLMYHGARNYIARKAKDEKLYLKSKVLQADGKEKTKGRGNFTKQENDSYLFHRKNYSSSVKEVFNVFRKMLQQST